MTHATFHDLRHTFVTNARRAGIDYFRTMAVTGRKVMAVFKRCDTIDRQDLPAAIRPLDTHMETIDVAAPSMQAQVVERRGMGR